MDMLRANQDSAAVTETAPPGDTALPFASAEELEMAAASWPLSRLVAFWNALPGVVPINRFTDRKTALRPDREMAQQGRKDRVAEYTRIRA
jgi:hypothetical protein